MNAAYSLGLFGERAASAVPALSKQLRDRWHGELKKQVVIALARIGPGAQGAKPELLAHLKKEYLQALIAYALGRIGLVGPDVENALVRLSSSAKVATRYEAVRALGIVARPSEDIKKALQARLEDETPEIVAASGDALLMLERRAPADMVPEEDEEDAF